VALPVFPFTEFSLIANLASLNANVSLDAVILFLSQQKKIKKIQRIAGIASKAKNQQNTINKAVILYFQIPLLSFVLINRN
jgi:hypothetical protein